MALLRGLTAAILVTIVSDDAPVAGPRIGWTEILKHNTYLSLYLPKSVAEKVFLHFCTVCCGNAQFVATICRFLTFA